MGEDGSAPAKAKAKKKWALLSAPAEPAPPPSWLPLPHIVALLFVVFLVFVLMGVVVTALVLGGTISVSVKGIGLTQSLVLFAGIFTLAYMGLHVVAARRPDYDAGRQPFGRPPLHTRAVVLARITAALWAVTLIAVGITLSELPASDPAQASAVGAIRCDLAASLINCLGMITICLVVERTKYPFRVHWITSAPPDPNASSAAKALIKDILGDGVGGSHRHARVESDDEEEDDDATAAEPATPPPSSKKTAKESPTKDCEKGHPDAASSSATLVGTPLFPYPTPPGSFWPATNQHYMPVAGVPSMASLHPAMHPAMHPAAMYPGMMHPGSPLDAAPPILQPPAAAASRAGSPYSMGYFPYQMPPYPYMSPPMPPEPAVAPAATPTAPAAPAAAPEPVAAAPAAAAAAPPAAPAAAPASPQPPSPAPPETPIYRRLTTPPVHAPAPTSTARLPVFTRPENSVPPRVHGGPRPFPRPAEVRSADDRPSPGNGRYKPYTPPPPSWMEAGAGGRPRGSRGYRRPDSLDFGGGGGQRTPGSGPGGGQRASNGSSIGGPRSPGGKRLFDQAAAGLRYSSGSYASPAGLSAPFEPRDGNRGVHIPGAFE